MVNQKVGNRLEGKKMKGEGSQARSEGGDFSHNGFAQTTGFYLFTGIRKRLISLVKNLALRGTRIRHGLKVKYLHHILFLVIERAQ